MKVLIIGSGGREHAIAWKTAQSPLVNRIYCAPGNGGTYFENKCENISLNGIDELLKFAVKNSVDLTIVGPEIPLVEGIVDRFKEKGLKIFGPSREAAMLEGSKSYSKSFMDKYGVKTAWYRDFDNADEARNFLSDCDYPVVIKADGLAAGKGVVICNSFNEAEQTIDDFMIKDIFKGSGKRVIVEEFLEGVEASILSITDGKTIIPFLSAKDHKAIYEGNKGPNTGGMGVIAPNPYVTDEVLRSFNRDIMLPTLRGIQGEQMDYKGIIFFGIMITAKGVYLLEYNVRMGDPETQAVLPLMESDFIELILAALEDKLDSYNIKWKKAHSCCVVAASKGYPGKYETGFNITGIKDANNKIFIAGGKNNKDKLMTSGGRVLAATALGKTLEEAINNSYRDIERVEFNGIYFRRDIGEI
ncbi:MAG: phosphoribosylformylglycinamidine synthase [Clostridiales bacterium]|jgi:phosphoribosylamine--glycine ligase|nr:phosphoribosylformylglycinamidine synthase [Clostridiales bacterium]